MNNPEMAVVPPGGGWRFLQKLPNGANRPFLATSKKKLYEEVLEFRRNNNLPTDTLQEELARGVSAPVTHSQVTAQGRSLRERVTNWLLGRQFGTVRYVSQDIADARASLAVACPNNVTNYADECIECFNSTARGLFAIRQGRTTPYDESLGACKVCGWDNRTAVHLAPSCLQNRDKGLTPSECWCSKIDENTNREVS
jgi:hypothetical protein